METVIRNDETKGRSVKEIRTRERKEKEDKEREACTAYADERFGKEELKQLSSKNKGIWFLPIWEDQESLTIEKFAVMKPVDRNILSYASTKMTDEGLYAFLESAMRECFLLGDKEILDEDEYFIPASTSFNKIMEGKKASLLKR
jgi:hypothetical protein